MQILNNLIPYSNFRNILNSNFANLSANRIKAFAKFGTVQLLGTYTSDGNSRILITTDENHNLTTGARVTVDFRTGPLATPSVVPEIRVTTSSYFLTVMSENTFRFDFPNNGSSSGAVTILPPAQIFHSYNVSSILDENINGVNNNSAGIFTINYESGTFQNTNYLVSTCSSTGAVSVLSYSPYIQTENKTSVAATDRTSLIYFIAYI